MSPVSQPLRSSMPAIALAAGLTGCLGGTSPEPADGLKIAVAPLSLPTVSKVCYDILVTNGPDKTGDTVWSKGTPGLNGGTADSDAICSTQYGNLGGGGISYVGPCDADGQEDPSDAAGERMNSVTIWFDGLYDGGNAYVDPDGPQGWQNPCLDQDGDEVGCTLNVLCEENADAEVEFNFTILREANQGFFDIAVNFGDIFCSAKFDCSYSSAGVCSGAGGTCTTGTLVDGKTTCDTNADCVVQDPINLLHNGQGQRDRTFVLGFACTAGPGADVETDLYLNDLQFDCNGDGNSAVFTADFTLNTAGVIDGNQCTAGAMEDCGLVTTHGETLDPDDYFFQYAVYRGAEQLEDSLTNAPLNKKYWNVAIGVKPAIAGCQIRTAGTAEDVANLDDGANNRRIEPGQTYPAIVWDVRADSCAQEVLSVGPAGEYFANAAGEPAMVRVLYTAIDNEGVTFDNAYSGTIPLSQRCRTHSDCRTGFQCTNDGTCRDADGEIQGECLRDVFDEDATALSAPAAGGYKWAGWTRLPSDVGVRQTANSTATVFPTRLEATAGEIVFTARVVAGGDDDYIGWAVGATANATGLGSPGGEFLLFKWKRSTQSGAAGGLRLARVNGVADNNAIWTDTGAVSTVASATACANPPATALDCGWQRDRGYRVRMAYATSRIQVWITPEHRVGARYNVDAPVFRDEDEVQVFDVVGTFPTGALGFFSQSQPGSEFRVISVNDTAPDAQECGTIDSAAAGWSKAFGPSDWGDSGEGGLATDSAGNIYLAGTSRAAVDFGGGSLAPDAGTAWDGVVAKFDPAGEHLWSLRSTSDTEDGRSRCRDIAVDGAGNVIVVGQFRGTVDFAGVELDAPTSDYTLFLAKLDELGVVTWVKTLAGRLNPSAIAVDGDDRIILTGTFNNTVNLGGADLVGHSWRSSSFLAVLDPSGDHLWSQGFVASAGENGSQTVTVSPAGDIIIGGSFYGTTNFGGSALSSPGGAGFGAPYSAFVAAFDESGAHLWSAGFGSDSRVTSLATAANGDILLGGVFQGSISFGGPTHSSAPGQFDGYLVRLTGAGGHVWSQVIGGPAGVTWYDMVTDVAIGSDGLIAVAGRFVGTATIAGQALSTGLEGGDAFLAAFDGAGNGVWARSAATSGDIDGYGYNAGSDIVRSPTGAFIGTGVFYQRTDFGHGTRGQGDGDNLYLVSYPAAGP